MYLKKEYSFLLQKCETCYTSKRKLESSSEINKHVRSRRHQNGRRFIDALTKGSTGKDEWDNEKLTSGREPSDSGSYPGIDTYEPHSDSESKESESEVEFIEDKVEV